MRGNHGSRRRPSPDRRARTKQALSTLASRKSQPVLDHPRTTVVGRALSRPGLDAAVLRLLPSFRGLAVSLDGTGRIARLDPHTGGALAVLEAARNVACAGGEPLAVTDCLNFGNPEKPEIAWELAEVIEGMAAACEALGIPVVSGNVSLYNETDGRAIPPTRSSAVGPRPDVRRDGAWNEGDAICWSATGVSFDGSEYPGAYAEPPGGGPLDLAAEAAPCARCASPRLSRAHDVAEGGLAVCLEEAAIASGIGRARLHDAALLWRRRQPGGRCLPGTQFPTGRARTVIGSHRGYRLGVRSMTAARL